MSRKDLSGLESDFTWNYVQLVGERQELETLRCASPLPAERRSYIEPFFLSLPSRPVPRPPPLLPSATRCFLFLFLGTHAVACARANSRRIGISSRRGLCIERYSDRDVSQLPAMHAAVILSRTRELLRENYPCRLREMDPQKKNFSLPYS